jgi:protein tyrosine phosphatase
MLRYLYVHVDDFNRVKLTMGSDNDNSDFINASFISVRNVLNCFYISLNLNLNNRVNVIFTKCVFFCECCRVSMEMTSYYIATQGVGSVSCCNAP